jgi:lysophospholipase L1-like esterase
LEVPEAAPQETLGKYREKLKYYRVRLEQLIQVCRAHGIAPVFLTQPTLYGPGLDPVTGVDLAQIKLGEHRNGALAYAEIELYNDALRQVCEQEKAKCIDLARELPRNSAYYYDYLHYTEAGAAQVAEIIYRELKPFLTADNRR